MTEHYYKEFKENIARRDEHKTKAEKKKAKASKTPIIGDIENWLAKRHENKAQKHQEMAYESAAKHADALKKKHEL